MKRSRASIRSSSVRSSSVSAPAAARLVRRAASRSADRRAKRWRKALSCVSTCSCSPVSASRNSTRPRSGSSSSSGSNRRTATTSWRCASWASGFSQPGALMKSDTTNTVERLRMPPSPACSSKPSCVPPAARSAAGCSSRCTSCSTCARLLRGGSTASTARALRPSAFFAPPAPPAPYSMAPTRLPWRVSRRASTATKRVRMSRLAWPCGPKWMEGLRSSRNQADISRSSVNTRTWGAFRRAVTFQSMWRTSSWGWYSRRSARSSPLPRTSVR